MKKYTYSFFYEGKLLQYEQWENQEHFDAQRTQILEYSGEGTGNYTSSGTEKSLEVTIHNNW